MRNWTPLSTQAAQLADVLYTLGRFEDAQTWAEVAKTNASDDDASAQLSWMGVTARLLARAGDIETAEALVRDGVRVADATDALNQQASAKLAAAEVLTAAGKKAEAVAAEAEAIRLLDLKGNAAAVAQAQSGQRAAAFQ